MYHIYPNVQTPYPITTIFTLNIGTLKFLTLFHQKFEQLHLTTCWRVYGIWSGSTLFAQACLSEYLGLLQYIYKQIYTRQSDYLMRYDHCI